MPITQIVTGGPGGLLAAETVGDTMQGPLTLANQGAAPAATAAAASLYASGGMPTSVNPQGLVSTIGGSQGGLLTAGLVTVANTAAESLVYGMSLPAADPTAGSVYRLEAWGVFSSTGTPTIAFTSRLGGTAGTSLAALPAFTLAALTSAPWRVRAVLNFLSATTAQCLLEVDLDSSASTDVSGRFISTPTAAVTVSVSTAKVWQVDVTWGTAATGNTISLLGAYSERVA
jgi:hypothetical protein